jgi:hypothetical protein
MRFALNLGKFIKKFLSKKLRMRALDLKNLLNSEISLKILGAEIHDRPQNPPTKK